MIRIDNLIMSYQSPGSVHQAVRGISLDVGQGQFYTLLGPSGCGKTTTLRCVAGLERPDSGEIVVGEQTVFSSEKNICVPPHQRNIGMVFQSYAIWPHMTVFENVALPLRYMKPRPERREVRERVVNALSLVKLDGLEERPAPFLSGGQQQRLALARALVAEPRVLLLDEPLSNLDAKLREEMRLELRDLVKRLDVTTLFVTHEQIEALTMSDVIAVMNEGRVVQHGSAGEIYSAPREPFVADFIGKMNFLPGEVVALDEASRVAQVATAFGRLSCLATNGLSPGHRVTLAVRPENFTLGDGDGATGNVLAGQVETVVFLGNILECAVRVAQQTIRVQLHPGAPPCRGDNVVMRVRPEDLLVMRH